MVTKDAHPFLMPRVRKYLEQEPHLDESPRMKWLRQWLDAGSRAIEDALARDPRTERFCYGDRLTIADICLVAHLTNTKLLCDPPSCYVIHPLRQAGAQATAPLYVSTRPGRRLCLRDGQKMTSPVGN
jgi:glutathione S-transferase